MNRRKTITRHLRPGSALLLAALLLASPGCVKRDLELRPEEGSLSLSLDWGGDPRPRTARFLFYDESGALVREARDVTDRYEGTFPQGTYRLVVHNTDAGQVDWRGTERYETAEVYARETDYSEGHHPAAGVPCVQPFPPR